MESVLTLVGHPTARDLASETVLQVSEVLRHRGAEVGSPDWLADRLAADLPFSRLDPRVAMELVRQALGEMEVDLVAQPAAGRLKRLLIADMDSTMVQSETMDDMAALLGIGAEVSEITRRTMLGELKFEESLRRRVAMLEGHPWAVTREVVRALTLSPGARSMVRSLRAQGCYTVLCSGGFTFCTEPVAEICGFNEHHANVLLHADGKLTGRVAEPILGRAAKVERLRALVKERGLKPHEVAAIGDGANDIGMLQAAGLGVAYRGKPAVREATPYHINHSDLSALAYFQGLREEELIL